MAVEDIIKSFVQIIFGIIVLGALASVIGSSLFGLSSALIGLTVFAVIIVFILKVLKELEIVQ